MWLRIELVSLRVALFILLNSSANELRRKKRSLLLKYLLVQFVSRGITLASWFLAESWGALLFTVSLCLKLGLFPAHSWVVDIFRVLSFFECFTLGVVSKVRPFVIAMEWGQGDYIVSLRAFSVVSGSILGLVYSDLRHTIACSSIIGTRWLCIATFPRPSVFILSFIFYSLSNLSIFWLLSTLGWSRLSDAITGTRTRYKTKYLGSLALLTNLGLPIFLFFLLKIVVIVETKSYFTLLVLLVLGGVSIVWYSRISTVIWSHERYNVVVWKGKDVAPSMVSLFILSRPLSLTSLLYLFV